MFKKGKFYLFMFVFSLCTSVMMQTSFAEEESSQNGVLAMADSLEEAEALAQYYEITLLSYDYGVAVFTEPTDQQDDTIELYEDMAGNTVQLYPNTIYTVQGEIADPYSGSDAMLYGTYGSAYPSKSLDLEKAHAYGATGEGVLVAIIDSGVDTDHPLLESSLSSDLCYNSHTGEYGFDAVEDVNGHGTHVAGIIAGDDLSSTPSLSSDIITEFVGVAPNAELAIIKGSRDYDHAFESASLIRGLAYAISIDADIINLSLGINYLSGITDIEKEAYQKAYDAGIVIIAAAGNDMYEHAHYPAALDTTIAVSATNSENLFAYQYSNYGSEIDISAPGTFITSTYLDGSLQILTGTSMASPMVAGVAALVLDENPNYSVADVKNELLNTARDAGDFGWDQYYGNGIVNGYAAALGEDALCTVTYVDGDGKTLHETKFASGTKLLEPTPLDVDYFDGWLKADGTYFDFDEEAMYDITLYAKDTELKEAPDAPEQSGGYENNIITLVEIEGAEYGINTKDITPGTWQDSPTFTGLADNTTYYFFARYQATEDSKASEASSSLVITTSTLSFNSVDIKETPTYWDTWGEILNIDNYKAPTENTWDSYSFTIAIDGKTVDSSEMPDVDTFSCEVLFSGECEDNVYTNISVVKDSITVNPLEREVIWYSDTQYPYTASPITPYAYIAKHTGEEAFVTVESDTSNTNVGTGYTAEAIGLSGAHAYRYTLADTNLTTTYDIISCDAGFYAENFVLAYTYGDTIIIEMYTQPSGVSTSASADATVNVASIVNDDTVEFLYNGTALEKVDLTYWDYGWTDLYYDTTSKVLPIGESYITLYYSGSPDGNVHETTATDLIVVKLSPIELTSELIGDIPTQTYTGSAITPTISIDHLVLDEDYTVEYENNIYTGLGQATITGISDYCTGTVIKTFTIKSASSSSGGGSSTTSKTTTETETTIDMDIEITDNMINGILETDGLSATITKDELSQAIQNLLDAQDDEDMVLTLQTQTDGLEISFSNEAVDLLANSDLTSIVITSDLCSTTISTDVLKEILNTANGEDITLEVEEVENSYITDGIVLEFMIYAGDSVITDIGGNSIYVEVPYALAENEDPGAIMVFYIDEDGNKTILFAEYKNDTECIAFAVEKFSHYAICYGSLYYTQETNVFEDVFASDYFYDSVIWAVENEITSGTGENLFSPDEVTTRAQAITFLWRLNGCPEPTSTENAFTDINSTDYFYKAVLWAVENEITSGMSEDIFGPNTDCQRGHIVTFLWNMANKPSANTDSTFADVSEDAYYSTPVAWAVEMGIASGMEENIFDAENLCTRNQVVSFLYRFSSN